MNQPLILWIILLIFMIVVFITHLKIIMYKSINLQNHKNSSSLYAHFSQIDTYNYFIFPKLIFTHPQKFKLTKGQGIYIPKKWWHWVTATRKTFAINFWFNNNIADNMPFVINTDTNTDIDIGSLNNETVTIWHSLTNDSEETTFKLFYNSRQDNKYIITLGNYNLGMNNSNIKDIVHPFVKLPNDGRIDVNTNDYDYNIWISAGKHTTGLHYDDEDGLLTVVEGMKEIILFPPSDTKYLYAYDVLYKWTHPPLKDLNIIVIHLSANVVEFHPGCYYIQHAIIMCAYCLTFLNCMKNTASGN